MQYMDDVLAIIFFDNTLRQWLTAAACIAGGLVAGKICSLLMRRLVKALKKTKTTVDDLLVAASERPLALLIFLAGIAIGTRELWLAETIRLWTDRALNSLFIIIITWALTRAADSLIVNGVPANGSKSLNGAVSPNGALSPNETRIQPLLRKFSNCVLWLAAVVLILRTIGYNVSALMAGLGLGGAALALASKDTLANFFGSITVFVDRPFRINDRIRIGAYDGVITEMGIRTSRLRTPENRLVFIPNSLFASQPIENISAQPNIKVAQTIGFKSENGRAKIERGIAIIRETAADDPGLEGTAVAALVSIGGLTCQANVVYYVSKQADYEETVNRINLELLRRFEAEEIKLA
jgi:MscS family membrane protein